MKHNMGAAARRLTAQSLRCRSDKPTRMEDFSVARHVEWTRSALVDVLDLRTIMPWDKTAVLASVRKTSKVLIVHEDTRTGGIAGEIAMRVSEKAFEWLDAPMLRVTAIDAPVPYSGSLEDYFLPQVDDVVKAARYLAAY